VLREEPGDLELGIQALAEAAEVLEYEGVPERDRRVALLPAQTPDTDIRGQIGGKSGRPGGLDDASFAGNAVSARDEVEQPAAEGGIVERVDHVGAGAERNRIAIGIAALEADGDDADEGIADSHAVDELDGRDSPRLAGEPALGGEPGRECFRWRSLRCHTGQDRDRGPRGRTSRTRAARG
jgi:hypothetical protein